VLLGGYSGNQWEDVWRSEDEGETWENIACAPWSQRFGHSSVVLPDGSIVLMGGYAGIGVNRFNDVWRSTDKGKTWTLMTAEAKWSGRYNHTSVVLPDGSIVLMSGFFRLNDIWRSTDQGKTWTLVTEEAEWSGRDSHTSVVLLDGTIVLMGGDDGSYKNDVWISDDAGQSWVEQTSDAAWSARESHSSVALVDGTIVLMGGYSSGDRNSQVYHSVDQGKSWTRMTEFAEWSQRSGHTSVVLPDGSVVLMGGSRGKEGLLNDVWRSTDGGVTWTEITQQADWPPRTGHTSVVLLDGSIVLMGGIGSYLNDVWRLETGPEEMMNYLPLIMR
jgi:type II secretory pathway component GspD/PulD (secretin)